MNSFSFFCVKINVGLINTEEKPCKKFLRPISKKPERLWIFNSPALNINSNIKRGLIFFEDFF